MDNVNFPQGNDRDLGLIDFMDEENLEQFIDLIRGENEEPMGAMFFQQESYGCENISGYLADDGQGLFEYDNVGSYMLSSANVSGDDVVNILPTGENDAGEVSSETTPEKKGTKADRSKTLVCERKRRGRMKEMLYSLRSLVPNITKMDKASIIADAVLYVQDLQMQTKKLKAEIANLESSTTKTDKYEGGTTFLGGKKTNFTNTLPILKKIFKMDVFQVEETGFYVRIVSSKGQQVAASLYKAVDSLASLFISSSNLATASHNYVFTFTFTVRECESDINLPNLKLWIASAFLNQGFGFEASLS
ncbi:PREDICTED: transcription factor FER-LIKE IRON DEFICIENCY-INDUCED TRANSCRIPTION FACTOR [Ipomoea nil]|uniref:transcription factor FER-LIKE IRON DEFICIENCY-INDUCED TRANSCRIPTION FACTOR n=1 Tax=Ipomoea nil TaxID=35883 RepID=UPI000900EB08|nr:PREDICTED: transcription factor FER-LIKE IRON DEFICIENCY-INDUCED TRANSCRIPTION FACTOR [Ipomoea nil]